MLSWPAVIIIFCFLALQILILIAQVELISLKPWYIIQNFGEGKYRNLDIKKKENI